jgi:hypothetical protein
MLQPTVETRFIASLIVAPFLDFGSNWIADAINRVSTGRIFLELAVGISNICLWLKHLANQVDFWINLEVEF